MVEINDYDLVIKCINGDGDAFTELVARYKKLVYSVVHKYISDKEEVNDVSQEVFIKIYKSLKSYNPEYAFSTWTVTVTRNFCIDYIRKRKIESVAIEEIEVFSREENTPESEYINNERTKFIKKAINSLPEKYRKPIILYHHRGASYKEIAQILKEPMSIIKNRLYRARLLLRERIADVY